MDLKKLLPPGRAWKFSEDSQFVKLLRGFEEELKRAENAVVWNMISESDPATATETLDQWEKMCGIVRDYAMTDDQRRAVILSKLNARGGQSAEYFTNLAAGMGFTVSVTDLTFPAFISSSKAGIGVFTRSAVFIFLIEILSQESWADVEIFKASILRYRPAHTYCWLVGYQELTVVLTGVATANYTVKAGSRIRNNGVTYTAKAQSVSTAGKILTLELKADYPGPKTAWVPGKTSFLAATLETALVPGNCTAESATVSKTGSITVI